MRERLRLTVRGTVQGVGFRPFLFRLAQEFGLDGWVNNSPAGVHVEVEGPRAAVEAFYLAIEPRRPPAASIHGLEGVWLDPVGYRGFEIRPSAADTANPLTTPVLPDLATCAECRAEIFSPSSRRFRYPFTNCTNCGPRYSLVASLPYDRSRTSMRAFSMCPACAREYGDPADRRFHAQPIACPACGPQVAVWDRAGAVLATAEAAMVQASAALRDGRIVAVKGLGGFHLMTRASSAHAVAALRARKHRLDKPLAIMVPSLADAEALCEISAVERRLLLSPAAPIVLLRRRPDAQRSIAPDVAPGNPWLGLMLPYTPLHHLLLADLGEAVVATSGNLSEEPICIDEYDALERLAGVADLFLVHDRPILRHVDDSVARVQLGRELVLRRARGYAPLPVLLPQPAPAIVAVGAHLKSAVAVSVDRQVFVSQHIGDLDTPQALEAFGRVLNGLGDLYAAVPTAAAADLHPDYASTRWAAASGLPVTYVQHHYAHVLSCAAENDLTGAVLGVSWDGTGLGTDGTIWGGEFLLVDDRSWRRWACLRPFRLPGGERAVREPRRSAFGALLVAGGPHERGDAVPSLAAVPRRERDLWARAIEGGTNAPVTSSAGRLFDAVASLAGLRQVASFEGQAAMELEWAADPAVSDAYPWRLAPPLTAGPGSFESPPVVIDWAPAIAGVVRDVTAGVPVGTVAARWHVTMADVIVGVARSAGHPRVVLSGGCFQNTVLCELVDQRLRAEGFTPYWHQRVPPNDGGIALGQVVAALRSPGA